MIAQSRIFPMALSDICRSEIYGVFLRGKLLIKWLMAKLMLRGRAVMV